MGTGERGGGGGGRERRREEREKKGAEGGRITVRVVRKGEVAG